MAGEEITLSINDDKAEIKQVTLKELKKVINCDLNAKKVSGYDLITGHILKNCQS